MKAVAVHRVLRALTARQLYPLAQVLALLLTAPFAKGAERVPLPNVDKRAYREGNELLISPERQKGLAHLREFVLTLQVAFDPMTGGPKWIAASDGLLSG